MIELARRKDRKRIAELDRHIPPLRLDECIRNGQVYVLRDAAMKNDGRQKPPIVGVLRYSLFWQTIPFLDLLYIDVGYRGKGFGTQMMNKWEDAMKACGYQYVMTSTQSDETAWRFYEKRGYRKAGEFLPPEQTAGEWLYWKRI